MEINPIVPIAGQKLRGLSGIFRGISEFLFTYSTISYETPKDPDVLFC